MLLCVALQLSKSNTFSVQRNQLQTGAMESAYFFHPEFSLTVLLHFKLSSSINTVSKEKDWNEIGEIAGAYAGAGALV